MKDYWAIALENIGTAVVFGVVAVMSNHWWIILFTLFSFKSITTTKKND